MTQPTIATFCWRVTATHMVAYLIAGMTAQVVFNYEELLFADALASLMRPYDSIMITLAPSLQAINGLAMALILWPVRKVLLDRGGAWALFVLVAGFTLFAPQAPSPGSFEGWIYTEVPVWAHLIGVPEALLYSGLFALGVTLWHRHPGRAWNIVASILILLIALISLLGSLDVLGMLPEPP